MRPDDITPADIGHFLGFVLVILGTSVALFTHGTATGAVVAIVAGAVLCLWTYEPGRHGPWEG